MTNLQGFFLSEQLLFNKVDFPGKISAKLADRGDRPNQTCIRFLNPDGILKSLRSNLKSQFSHLYRIDSFFFNFEDWKLKKM